MVVVTKVQPIDRDLIVRLTGTEDTRRAMLASFAREKLAEGEQQNLQVLGRVPPHKTFVDRVQDASEDPVKPDGVIVYEFELVSDALSWIGDQLQKHSPIGAGRDPHPGLYQKSHELFADGTQVIEGADVPPAAEYVFLNALPYARKIQRWFGVYEAVAAMAGAQFGNTVKVRFTYRAPEGSSLLKYVSLGRVFVRDHRGRYVQAESTGDRAAAAHERDLRVPAIVVTVR